MRISGKIACGSRHLDQSGEGRPVAGLCLDDSNQWQSKPRIDLLRSSRDRQSGRKNSTVRGEAKKANDNNPWQADGLVGSQRIFPPGQYGRVMWSIFIDDVEQDVQIDNLHFLIANLRTVSSSSNAAATLSAFSRGTLGSPIAYVSST